MIDHMKGWRERTPEEAQKIAMAKADLMAILDPIDLEIALFALNRAVADLVARAKVHGTRETVIASFDYELRETIRRLEKREREENKWAT